MAQRTSRDRNRSKQGRRRIELEGRVSKRIKVDDTALEAISGLMNLDDATSELEAVDQRMKVTARRLMRSGEYELSDDTKKCDDMSQLKLLVIRRLISEASIPPPRNKDSLFKLLVDIAKELMLNEFELVVWAIYLQRFVWRDQSLPLETLLTYSAFAAKTHMHERVADFRSQLSSRFPVAKATDWMSQHKGLMGIGSREFKDTFKRMTKPLVSQEDLKVIDYNYYVDELLQISHPNTQDNSGAEARKMELQEDSLELDASLFSDELALQPAMQKQHSQDEYESPGLLQQLTFGTYALMTTPSFENFEGLLPCLSLSRTNSVSAHQMQLRRHNSKGELTSLPSLRRQSSFVASLINSKFL
jgi:hypothetical protein